MLTNHGENGQILQNDGTGHFTDITAGSGFVTNVDPIESVVEDFDNDGFLDILISGGGSAGNSPWIVYKNNGNSTFTMLSAPTTVVMLATIAPVPAVYEVTVPLI